MADHTTPTEAPPTDDARAPSRWMLLDVLRHNGTWILVTVYGIGTLGAILFGLTYTEFPIELAACVVAPYLVALLIPVVRRRFGLLVLAGVCLVAVLGLSEALFRVRHFGTDAIVHPLAYSPASNTSVKSLIRQSEDPELGYELTPGFDQPRNGKRYSFNSWGYRDREFTREKKPGVLRIVVLGDSFAMASGVEAENGLSRALERRLNEMGVAAEVYNLAVSGYELPQIERVLETDALALKPDIVVLAVWSWVAGERWPDEEVDWERMVSSAQKERQRQHVVRYFSFVRGLAPRLQGVMRRLEDVKARIGLAKRAGGGKQPLAMPIFLDRLATLGRKEGFTPALWMLRPLDFRAGVLPRFAADRDVLKGWCDERGVLFIDTLDVFPIGAFPNDYIIYPGNSHPNARSHAIYAESAAEQLEAARALELPSYQPVAP